MIFHCGGRRFGVPLTDVTEVVPAPRYTRLPGAGAEVCGLVGVRGGVVTVADGGVLFGDGPTRAVPDHRLLMLDIAGGRVALAVDEVLEIARARVDDSDAKGVVAGTGRSLEGEFTALDVRAAVAPLLDS